jgi:AcrR family transcriptional regulator
VLSRGVDDWFRREGLSLDGRNLNEARIVSLVPNTSFDALAAERPMIFYRELPPRDSECTVTPMPARSSILSTAEVRRPLVAAGAVREFARGGFHGTTVADVAGAAKISPAYVFKLFPSKEKLFVAALDECFEQIVSALSVGADNATAQDPGAVLFAMGGAYADLIKDRTLLMLQVHAQSAADIPEIGDALRAGLAKVTTFAKDRSGGSDDDVQRFIAYGQLCHLLVTARIDEVPEPWAILLSHGIRHPG